MGKCGEISCRHFYTLMKGLTFSEALATLKLTGARKLENYGKIPTVLCDFILSAGSYTIAKLNIFANTNREISFKWLKQA